MEAEGEVGTGRLLEDDDDDEEEEVGAAAELGRLLDGEFEAPEVPEEAEVGLPEPREGWALFLEREPNSRYRRNVCTYILRHVIMTFHLLFKEIPLP